MIDLGYSQPRGYVRAATEDGRGVVLTGNVGETPDDLDGFLVELVADHPVERYPEDALIGLFTTGGVEEAELRDPREIRIEPFPYGGPDGREEREPL